MVQPLEENRKDFESDVIGLISSDEDLEVLVRIACKEMGLDYKIIDMSSVEDIHDFAAIIASDKEKISDEKISKSYLTPIIFIAEPKEAQKFDKKKFNIYEICEFSEKSYKLNKILANAVDNKHGLLELIGDMLDDLAAKADEIPFPKFNNLLESYYDPKKLLNKVWTALQPLFKTRHELIKGQITIDDSINAEEIFDKNLSASWAVAAPEQALKRKLGFLYREYIKSHKRFMKLLGDDEIKDGVHARASEDWGVFRFEKSSNGYEAQKIAIQYFLDTQRFKNTDFKVAEIYFPMPYQTENQDFSFWVAKYIPGIPLHKILNEVNESIKEGHWTAPLLKKLRTRLVNKCVEDLKYWMEHPQNTFVKKPNENELVNKYIERTKPLLSNLNNHTKLNFSEEEQKLLDEGLNIYKELDLSKEEYVVRYRDSSFNNVVFVSYALKEDGKVDLEDLLLEITTEADEKPPTTKNGNKRKYETKMISERKFDDKKINERFYHVDLQYRWAHVLEDIAQITTMYEAEYLWKTSEEDDKINNIKKPNDCVRKFLNDLGMDDLAKDTMSFKIMYLYRAARKLSLFCEYWQRHYLRRKNSFNENTRKRFYNNMLHYASISEYAAQKMIEDIKENDLGKADKNRLLACRDFYLKEEELYAKDHLKLINEINNKDAKNKARLYGLNSLFRKIKREFEKHGEDVLVMKNAA